MAFRAGVAGPVEYRLDRPSGNHHKGFALALFDASASFQAAPHKKER
ncbi:hypothetical protein AB4072_13690 [Microvirga sp. 2MCAF38]